VEIVECDGTAFNATLEAGLTSWTPRSSSSITWRGTGEASSVDYNLRAAEIFTLRHRNILRTELGFPDRAAALRAAALTE
jgi:hypothetical protein